MAAASAGWYTGQLGRPFGRGAPAMVYALLAALTVAVHAAFIAFVAVGGLVVARYPRVALLHMPAVLWAAFVEFSGRICPLTPLENRWRALAGAAGYPEGFIEHYTLGIMYPQGLTAATQVALGTLVLLGNAGAYLWLLRRARCRGARSTGVSSTRR